MVRSRRARRIILLLLVLWTVFVLFPLYWTITVSMKDGPTLLAGATFIPWFDFQPSFHAWENVILGRSELLKSLTNSAVIALASSAAAVLLGSLAGYGLSRFRYRFGPMRNRDIAFWLVSQRVLPPVVLVLPVFVMFRFLQLLDTRSGMIILYTAFNLPIAGWLMYDYFRQVPRSLDEAAMVDGATTFQAFWRISLPLARPAIFATFLVAVVFAWNEFLYALVITFNEARTLPILVAGQATQHGPEWDAIAVMALVTVAPLVLITALIGNRLLKGLVTGWQQ